jgi:hypothetical protein
LESQVSLDKLPCFNGKNRVFDWFFQELVQNPVGFGQAQEIAKKEKYSKDRRLKRLCKPTTAGGNHFT